MFYLITIILTSLIPIGGILSNIALIIIWTVVIINYAAASSNTVISNIVSKMLEDIARNGGMKKMNDQQELILSIVPFSYLIVTLLQCEEYALTFAILAFIPYVIKRFRG